MHKKETFRSDTFQTNRDICYVHKGNTDVVMKENPGLGAATRWGVLKKLWQECGLPTKWLMEEKAEKKYKEEVEKKKREMESLHVKVATDFFEQEIALCNWS